MQLSNHSIELDGQVNKETHTNTKPCIKALLNRIFVSTFFLAIGALINEPVIHLMDDSSLEKVSMFVHDG